MIVILVSSIKEHPKVPALEQMFSTAAAGQNILLALNALGFWWDLANWKIRFE